MTIEVLPVNASPYNALNNPGVLAIFIASVFSGLTIALALRNKITLQAVVACCSGCWMITMLVLLLPISSRGLGDVGATSYIALGFGRLFLIALVLTWLYSWDRDRRFRK